MSTEKSYFRALSKLSREMGTTEDQIKMLHLIVSTAVKTLKAKAAVIFLRDEDSEDSIRMPRWPRLDFPKNTSTRDRLTPLKSARSC